jgi:hypothetical protein
MQRRRSRLGVAHGALTGCNGRIQVALHALSDGRRDHHDRRLCGLLIHDLGGGRLQDGLRGIQRATVALNLGLQVLRVDLGRTSVPSERLLARRSDAHESRPPNARKYQRSVTASRSRSDHRKTPRHAHMLSLQPPAPQRAAAVSPALTRSAATLSSGPVAAAARCQARASDPSGDLSASTACAVRRSSPEAS